MRKTISISSLVRHALLLGLACTSFALYGFNYNVYADSGYAGAGNKAAGSIGGGSGDGTECTPGTPWYTYACGGTSFRLYKLDPNKPNANFSALSRVQEEYIEDGTAVRIRITDEYAAAFGAEAVIRGCAEAGWYIRYGYEVAPSAGGRTIPNYADGDDGSGFQMGVGEVKATGSNTWSLKSYATNVDFSTKAVDTVQYIDGGQVPYHLSAYSTYTRNGVTYEIAPSIPAALSRKDGALDPANINFDALDGHRLLVSDVEDLFAAMPKKYKNGFTDLKSTISEGGLGYFCFSVDELKNSVTFHSTSGVYPLDGIGTNYLMTALDGEHVETQKTIAQDDPEEQTVNFTQYLYLDVGTTTDEYNSVIPKLRPETIHSEDIEDDLLNIPVIKPPATTHYHIKTTVTTKLNGSAIRSNTTNSYGIADPGNNGLATTDYGGDNSSGCDTECRDEHSWNFMYSGINMWNYFLDNEQTVNVPMNTNGRIYSVQICQKIEYTIKTIKYETTDDVTKAEPDPSEDFSYPYNTYACATITRGSTTITPSNPPTTNEDVNYSCRIYGYATATQNYGNTTGFTGVQNMTSSSGNNKGWHNTDAYYNGSNNSQTIYAKPGDSIQFHHCLTFGAQAVRGGGPYDHSTGDDKRYNRYPLDSRSQNWMNLDIRTTYLGQNTNEPKYLFRNANWFSSDNFTYSNGRYMIPLATARPWRFNYYNYAKADYVALIESPSTTQYSCNAAATLNASEWVSPGYQVHAFRTNPSNCAAGNSSNGVAVNDAGKTITQTMNYNYIEAWVYYVNTHKGGICTTCKGAKNRPEYTNTFVYTYQRAKDTSYQLGLNAEHCDRYCECDRPCKKGTCCSSSYYGPYERWSYPVMSNTYHFYCPYGEARRPTNSRTWSDHCSGETRWQEYAAPTATKSATVIIPYNFTTSVSSTSTDPDEGALAGETIDTDIEMRVNKRSNTDVSTVEYATIMPEKSKVEVVEFIIDDSVTYDSASSRNGLNGGIDAGYMADPSGNRSVCEFFRSVSSGNCSNIHTYSRNDSDVTKGFNISGLLNGETKNDSFTRTLTTTVPDIEVGQKYCVAVGVYPADSHNIIDGYNSSSSAVPSGNSKPGSHGGNNGVDDTGTYWNISRATCRTVTKKPNFQVWNGDTKAGVINTSITAKAIANGFSGSINGYPGARNTLSHRLFGSWDEYNVLATSEFKNFSSGAQLGYATPTLNPVGSGHITQSLSSGNLKNDDYCNFSPLTVANNRCSSKILGRSTSYATGTVLERLYSRYIAPAVAQGPTSNFTEITTGNTDNNQKTYRYWYNTSDITLNTTTINKAYNTQNESTYIVYTTGDVYIRGNLCYAGNKSCERSSQGRVPNVEYTDISFNARPGFTGVNVYNNNNSSYDFMNQLLMPGSVEYSSIDQLPQLIIFANNIYIDSYVTQIDAWLIASGGSTRAASGKINTCSNFTNRTTPADRGFECGNQLVVNGPVFASQLLLNRTAGAYPGTGVQESSGDDPTAQNILNDGSVTPAEIFNFRADAYLWAYAQSQDNRQAESTYMRELPPRY